MPWWLYIVVGFLVGAIGGGVATRLFYFPRNIGTVHVLPDPDTGESYLYLTTPYAPNTIPNGATVSMTIQFDKSPK